MVLEPRHGGIKIPCLLYRFVVRRTPRPVVHNNPLQIISETRSVFSTAPPVMLAVMSIPALPVQKPKRLVALRRDQADYVVAFQPDDTIVFRNPDADALRKLCRQLPLGDHQ
jgi:hypothetical protein